MTIFIAAIVHGGHYSKKRRSAHGVRLAEPGVRLAGRGARCAPGKTRGAPGRTEVGPSALRALII
jgi:hypothetical protein